MAMRCRADEKLHPFRSLIVLITTNDNPHVTNAHRAEVSLLLVVALLLCCVSSEGLEGAHSSGQFDRGHTKIQNTRVHVWQ